MKALALLIVLYAMPACAGEPAAPAAEINNILENARKMCELATSIEHFRSTHGSLPSGSSTRDVVRACGGGEGKQQYFATDPWGTPYRVKVDPPRGRYSIVGAGSDRRFDPDSWNVPKKSRSPADDVVLREGGQFVRSNHEWAIAQGDKLGARSEERLRRLIDASKALRTMASVRAIATALFAYLTEHNKFPEGDIFSLPEFKMLPREDAWGTPLRVTVNGDNIRIVSAGSDAKFDAGNDLARDLVMENDQFVTTWDTAGQGVNELSRLIAWLERARKELETAVAAQKP